MSEPLGFLVWMIEWQENFQNLDCFRKIKTHQKLICEMVQTCQELGGKWCVKIKKGCQIRRTFLDKLIWLSEQMTWQQLGWLSTPGSVPVLALSQDLNKC